LAEQNLAAILHDGTKRHSLLVSRLEKIRSAGTGSSSLPVIPLAQIRRTHNNVVSKIERFRQENKAADVGETRDLADKPAGAFLEASSGQKPVSPDLLNIRAKEAVKTGPAAIKIEPVAVKIEPAAVKTGPVAVKITAEGAAKTARLPGNVIKVKYPIAFKLVMIVAAMLIISLSAITFLVSNLLSSDVRLTAEDNNFSINTRVTESSEMTLNNVRSSALSLLNDITAINTAQGGRTENSGQAASPAAQAASRFFFRQNKDILAIAILPADGATSLISPSTQELPADASQFSTWLDGEEDAVRRAREGETVLLNASPFFGQPVLAMLLQHQNNSAAAVFYSTENFMEMFNTGMNISFMLNGEGDVLAHADRELVMGAVNLRRIPFVENALFNTDRSVQALFADENGVEYFSVFKRLLNGNAILITIIKKDDVLGSIQNTTRRNIFISIAVLIVSILVMLLFAGNISRPLRSLTRAARKIEEGEYDLELSHKSRDEIGVLTASFIGMGNGLENFEKFTNKVVVRLARQGKLTRGGVNKKITVCFLLIREFSELSEKMSATQIVDFVNEYLQLMVPCITRTGGIVDKFLTQGGVVIMALWGTVDTEKTYSENALACIRSTLMIRAFLLDFNRKLYRRFWGHSPLVKIGCGINSGDVVVGQMGSEQRMEYTVIGDTVNLAARIEGPNDLFDTDILISENTWELVRDKVICEEMPSIEVKGKEKPLRIFSIINMKEFDDVAKLYEELADIADINEEHEKRTLIQKVANMDQVRASWRDF
jgi:adenylate cyclase